MLRAYFQNDEMVTEGEICEGEFYQDFCCEGFGWEVRWVYHETEPGYNSIWGHCENIECPRFQKDIGPSDPWRGVRNVCQEEFAEWLAERAAREAKEQ